MQLCKVRNETGDTRVGMVRGGQIALLDLKRGKGMTCLADILAAPDPRIVGYSIGNDMSARDIEGENPLYLPQAKIYNGSCALGPVVTLPDAMPPPDQVTIALKIDRGPWVAFEGATKLTEMARTLEDLVKWLGRENSFPHGVVLLTGTGVVPPDEFTLQSGD